MQIKLNINRLDESHDFFDAILSGINDKLPHDRGDSIFRKLVVSKSIDANLPNSCRVGLVGLLQERGQLGSAVHRLIYVLEEMVADYHESPPRVQPVRFVVGFAFDVKKSHVVLVEKRRPEWQAGKLNGPGGHCEGAEDPVTAMDREFGEECGVSGLAWKVFSTLHGKDVRGGKPDSPFIVYFLSVFDDQAFKVRSKTDEAVHLFNLTSWPTAPVIPNLRWLVPMALSFVNGEAAASFVVQEQYSDAQLSVG